MRCCSQPPGHLFFNGIEDVVARPDLADRTMFITLDSITETRRRPERALWGNCAIAHHWGAANAVVHGLQKRQMLHDTAAAVYGL
jgi:hypothetical protein